MEWLPHTIDSFTNFAKEVGIFWVIIICLLGLMCGLIWRHSGAIVQSLQTMVLMRRDELVSRQDFTNALGAMGRELKNQSEELVKQTEVTMQTNSLTARLAEKLDKFGSDPEKWCKAMAFACRAEEAIAKMTSQKTCDVKS